MSENITEESAHNMFEFIRKICCEAGPGLAGTENERARGNIIKNEMETFCDKVVEEEFELSLNAYLGWFKLGVVLAAIGYIFFHLSLLPIAPIWFAFGSLLIAVLLFLMLYYEFILEKEFVDVIYPKGTSRNIIGSIYSDSLKQGSTISKPKKIIMLGGHYDSAYEFRWLKISKFGYYFAELVLILSVLIYLVGSTLWFFSVLLGSPLAWVRDFLWWVSITITPLSMVIGFTFLGSDKNGGAVPGALDNLSAVAVTIAIGKKLKQHPELIPKDSEIRLIAFGAEEAGVRGSRAYVKQHLQELKSSDSYFLNFETLYNPEISIFKSDRNGTLPHDQGFVKLVAEAAKKAGVPFRIEPFAFGGGGTDCIPFSENKIKSSCLFGMRIPVDMVNFYHQSYDNYDIINEDALKNAAKVGIETVRMIQ
jgi:hypothetical protein